MAFEYTETADKSKTIIPASAGFFALLWHNVHDGNEYEFCRELIIAWEISGDEVVPITVTSRCDESYAVIGPDGLVHNGGDPESLEDFKAHQNRVLGTLRAGRRVNTTKTAPVETGMGL